MTADELMISTLTCEKDYPRCLGEAMTQMTRMTRIIDRYAISSLYISATQQRVLQHRRLSLENAARRALILQ